jgi:hypothetical protein
MSEEELLERGLSRQRLLKRASVGAAVFMSAPVLASSAQALHGGRHHCGRDRACAANNGCNPPISCKPADPNCFCFLAAGGADGDGRCHCSDLSNGTFCSAYQSCTIGADCPDGFTCVITCCPTGICVPPCGSGAGGVGLNAAGSGPTVFG